MGRDLPLAVQSQSQSLDVDIEEQLIKVGRTSTFILYVSDNISGGTRFTDHFLSVFVMLQVVLIKLLMIRDILAIWKSVFLLVYLILVCAVRGLYKVSTLSALI